MIDYFLNPIEDNYLAIKVTFDTIADETTLHLPSWRPGRYQIQNFAKNVRKLSVIDKDRGVELAVHKTTKDSWLVQNRKSKRIQVSYEYYAHQKDAGGSYCDGEMLYVNPVNCCLYDKNRQDEACILEVQFPNNHKIACGLDFTLTGDKVKLQATNFHQLVDAPFVISNTLQHKSFSLKNTQFHIWVQGKIEVNWSQTLKDFEAFSKAQIQVFGEFPEPHYHYILWVPPQPYYHGVEHFNSTMMVLGPNSQDFNEMYPDLLGLSSHELFHTWNVKRIRPTELLPYRYNEENYFETCFVSEGLTTFYGDWMLYRSGVFSRKAYIKELETTLKRHFDFADESTLSLLESSYDLWLDGYEKGAINRKVSVYHKGAIAALILNHRLRSCSSDPYPLDEVMKTLWLQYGKPYLGFTYENYKSIVKNLGLKDYKEYFEKVIEGNESLFEETQQALAHDNIYLLRNKEGKVFLEDKALKC